MWDRPFYRHLKKKAICNDSRGSNSVKRAREVEKGETLAIRAILKCVHMCACVCQCDAKKQRMTEGEGGWLTGLRAIFKKVNEFSELTKSAD